MTTSKNTHTNSYEKELQFTQDAVNILSSFPKKDLSTLRSFFDEIIPQPCKTEASKTNLFFPKNKPENFF